MEWFNFASRLFCHICGGMGCRYFVNYSNAVPFMSLCAFLFRLPTLFFGRRFYKSLCVYAEILPISHNPSEVSSANHGCFTGNFRGVGKEVQRGETKVFNR